MAVSMEMKSTPLKEIIFSENLKILKKSLKKKILLTDVTDVAG